MTAPLPPDLAAMLARRGIDPNTEPDPPPEFDVVAFRVEQAQILLDRLVPAMYAEAKPDNSDVADWVAQFLAAPTEAPSVVLSGPTGVGKSHQGWGAIRACVKGVASSGRGLRWRATSHPDFNAAMRPSANNQPDAVLREYMQADLLFLDDLGAGKHTDWTGDNLYRLVDNRWSNRKTTIYSTNLSAGRLATEVGDRVVSRLADACQVTMAGPDRRWAAK